MQSDIQSNVSALTDDCHTRVQRRAAVLVRPKCDSIECIDIAITVRTKYWHLISRRYKLLLERKTIYTIVYDTVLARFGKS